MNVLLTGATGFVGSAVLNELLDNGFKVGCIVRKSNTRLDGLPVQQLIADVSDPASYREYLADFDAIIHLVAIIEEKPSKGITFERINTQATEELVKLASECGIKRFIHMSALGAAEEGITPYFKSKGLAEKAVRESGLDYTVFRPSFIYGPNDAVYSMIAEVIRKSPLGLYPVFGNGKYKHQPVSVNDIARAVTRSLENEKSFKKSYDIGGPEALSFDKQLELLGKAIRKHCRPIHIPLGLSKLLVGIAQLFPFSPIDRDRLNMLIRDNVCDNSLILADLDLELTEFSNGIEYLNWRYNE